MSRRCDIGVGVCHNEAITKRVTAGNVTRDVCAPHAHMIDRLRRQVEEDKPILDALRQAGDRPEVTADDRKEHTMSDVKHLRRLSTGEHGIATARRMSANRLGRHEFEVGDEWWPDYDVYDMRRWRWVLSRLRAALDPIDDR